ncbi:DUF1254 domain-containing protein [Streptomyces sp. NPDC051940]|uniref:DUF1254 domain-containing protein n=1 Tax=Streptomyces sp. NPDC051940 TaxID=3155675 RepID=UPI0034388705
MSKLRSDLRTLGEEAYIYLYPLVTMDVTREQSVNLPADANPAFGAPNRFHHIREFPPADFRAVVRPNFDTLYSSAWLDLTAGPVRLSVADAGDRYYMLPMLDMWTDVFASPGSRTTGTGPQEYTIVAPGQAEGVPSDTTLIEAPTPYVWIIGRVQTDGPHDYAAVNDVQDGFRLSPLVPAANEHEPDPGVDATDPLRIVNGLDAVAFFTRAAQALRIHPPHPTDFAVLARIAELGIVPGRPFDADRFTPDQLAEVEAGAKDALQRLLAGWKALGSHRNGWTVIRSGIGVYGNDYFQRAAVTMVGLGANPPEDAIYPVLATDTDGDPLTGEQDYVLHFDADALPPVSAFWSVTMYDDKGFQVANELDRFALGDRDPLTYNDDGSLDIHLSRTNPGPDREPNWLPAASGPLGVTLRLYAPHPEALDGRWTPPEVRKA